MPLEILNPTNKTVLVVDDNHAATDSLVRLLNALGCEAHGVYSAYEALDFLSNNEVQIVFLDIGMPQMNGYELARRLRSDGKMHLPIIAITGYGLEEDRRKAKEAGFTAHLTKPIGMQEINKILTEVA